MEVVSHKKVSFKEQQLKFREDAILDAVNGLLATKGFDLMTMDEVAAEVGIAKASLYKHFASKEDLAAAAMTRLLDRALGEMKALPADNRASDKLRAIVAWSIRVHLADQMPLLPSTRSSIRQAMAAHEGYMTKLGDVSALLGEWIGAGQAAGELSTAVTAELILYVIFARSCDPVVDFLREGGAMGDDEIVEQVVRACFDGIAAR
jgi:AcrR family transcriptional regulator